MGNFLGGNYIPPPSPPPQPTPPDHHGSGDGGLLGHVLGQDGLLGATGLLGDDGGLLGHLLCQDGLPGATSLFGDCGLLGQLLGKDGVLDTTPSDGHAPLLEIHLQVGDLGLLDWNHSC